MKYWIKGGTGWRERPEKTMFCDNCGLKVEYNPTLYCQECLQTATFSWKEAHRLKKLFEQADKLERMK